MLKVALITPLSFPDVKIRISTVPETPAAGKPMQLLIRLTNVSKTKGFKYVSGSVMVRRGKRGGPGGPPDILGSGYPRACFQQKQERPQRRLDGQDRVSRVS